MAVELAAAEKAAEQALYLSVRDTYDENLTVLSIYPTPKTTDPSYQKFCEGLATCVDSYTDKLIVGRTKDQPDAFIQLLIELVEFCWWYPAVDEMHRPFLELVNYYIVTHDMDKEDMQTRKNFGDKFLHHRLFWHKHFPFLRW